MHYCIGGMGSLVCSRRRRRSGSCELTQLTTLYHLDISVVALSPGHDAMPCHAYESEARSPYIE